MSGGEAPAAAPLKRGRRAGRVAELSPALTAAASLAALLALWALAAALWPSRTLPPPAAVWAVLVRDTLSGEIPFHLAMTLGRVAASFVIAMAIGAALGIFLGTHRRADRFFNPWVVLFLNVPALVIIVLAYIWFGLNERRRWARWR